MDILEQLKTSLELEVEVLLGLEEKIEDLDAQRRASSEVVHRLRKAIGALTGQLDEPLPAGETKLGITPDLVSVEGLEEKSAQVPPKAPAEQPPQAGSYYSDPICTGCGSSLYRSNRTLGNGRVVNLWVCSDSGCNNEVLAA